MFSTKKISVLTGAALALFATSAAVAGPMVVRSTGPSAKAFPVGKPLATDAKLPLKVGDVVTVLDSRGTRVLKGPGVVAVGGSAATSGSGFSQLIANAGARQARTGATRSAIGGGPARSPNVWYVDTSKGGAHCVADTSTASLWRPDNSTAANIVITSVVGDKAVVVDFRQGQSVRAWPAADLPITDGAQFKIDVPGTKAPVTVKALSLGGAGEGLDGVAAALLQKGCSNQMDVLVEGSVNEVLVSSAGH